MRRLSEVLGKPIVSADGGTKLGSVADLLLDETATALVAIVIGHGMFGSEQVLPYSEVQAIGPDAVVVKSAQGLLSRDEWRERGVVTARSSSLKDKKVVTSAGRTLGAVKDVHVDERSGEVEGYEIAGRSGLLARRSVLPRRTNVTVGPDLIVVAEEAVSDEPAPPTGQL